MAISSTVGLVSGINSKDIIDQLMSLEAQGKTRLQTRIDSLNQQKLAYTDLRTRLTSIRLTGTTLKKVSTFQNSAATSSDEDVMTATAASGAATGSFSLQVARLVSTQQTISRGFADFNSAKVGVGTMTFSLGGGELATQNNLSTLRGGDGVRRGQFRITDRSGASTVIDISDAVTVQDVVKKINTALDVQVKATLKGDQIELADLTGKTLSNLIVQDIGDGSSAADLGLVGNVAAATLTGTDVNFLGTSTALSTLNDGRGVRKASSGNDLAITDRNGTTTNVSLASAKTIGDVISAINTAGGSNFKASLTPGGNGLTLTDTTGGGGTLAVANVGDSKAADDLGLTATASGATLTGNSVVTALGTVSLKALSGGAGLTLGSVDITSRTGATTTVNLSASTSVQDILTTINSANAGVKADLNASGNGIQLVDTSGGTGNIVVASSGGGTTAEDLGINGTFDTSTTTVRGKSLRRAFVSSSTLLADYAGGKGVAQGKFKIVNSLGAEYTVNISSNNASIGDVIRQINATAVGVTASINTNGNGLLLTDTAGGGSKLKVTEVDSTTATDLNILGTATATTIDGAMEKTITTDANDTLATLQTKINNLGFGVTASIINDGTAATPFRLSLTAKNSGRAGRVTIDSGATALETRNLVEAQDSAVFLGGADSAQPLLITSSKNQIAGAIKGVTLNLNGVSKEPVTLNISRSSENIKEQMTTFTTTFNELVDRMGELTKFDTDTSQRGLLLGESTVQSIQTEIYSVFSRVVKDNGKYRTLGDVGLKLATGAKVEFDEEKFTAAYADDPDAVLRLFTLTKTETVGGKDKITNLGLGGLLEDAINKLIDPVDGAITRQNKEIDSRTTQFQDRISQMDKLLEAKRARLERQFSNMETILSKLQSQQTSLSQIKSVTSSS